MRELARSFLDFVRRTRLAPRSKSKRSPVHHGLLFETLEPRLLLSADPLVLAPFLADSTEPALVLPVAAAGRTGDVVLVDLKACGGPVRIQLHPANPKFSLEGVGDLTLRRDLHQPVHTDPEELKRYPKQPERYQLVKHADSPSEEVVVDLFFSDSVEQIPYKQNGVFYLVPSMIPPEGGDGFTGTLKVQFDSTGGTPQALPKETTIQIQEGYSISGDNAVQEKNAKGEHIIDKPLTDVLDIMRIQQRLRYLGFRDEQGNALQVNGVLDSDLSDTKIPEKEKGKPYLNANGEPIVANSNDETKWALGIFSKSVIDNPSLGQDKTLVREKIHTDQLGQWQLYYLNSSNAPRWVFLGNTVKELKEPLWGTSWLKEVLDKAQQAFPRPRFYGLGSASPPQGGPSHLTHYDGLAADLGVPGPNDLNPQLIYLGQVEHRFPFFYIDDSNKSDKRIVVFGKGTGLDGKPVTDGIVIKLQDSKAARAAGLPLRDFSVVAQPVAGQKLVLPKGYQLLRPSQVHGLESRSGDYLPFFATEDGILARGFDKNGNPVEVGFLAEIADFVPRFVVIPLGGKVSIERKLTHWDLLTRNDLQQARSQPGLTILGRLNDTPLADGPDPRQPSVRNPAGYLVKRGDQFAVIPPKDLGKLDWQLQGWSLSQQMGPHQPGGTNCSLQAGRPGRQGRPPTTDQPDPAPRNPVGRRGQIHAQNRCKRDRVAEERRHIRLAAEGRSHFIQRSTLPARI